MDVAAIMVLSLNAETLKQKPSAPDSASTAAPAESRCLAPANMAGTSPAATLMRASMGSDSRLLR